MAYLTVACIILYTGYDTGAWIQMWNYTEAQCRRNLGTWTHSWTTSKGATYCIFLLRLHMVFGETAYGYNKWIIYTLLTINLISCFTLPILSHIFASEHTLVLDEDEFPNPCFIAQLRFIYYWYLSWDMSMSAICLTLFIAPLTRSLRAVTKSVRDIDDAKKMSKKMIYVGVKLTILTAVASTSTMFSLCLLLIRKWQFVYPFDFVVNATCVMLMTQYYPDSEYYEKICCGCLLLCPVEYRSQSAERRRDKLHKVIESKDTMDAPQQAANLEISTTTTVAQSESNTSKRGPLFIISNPKQITPEQSKE